jgi:hypothetical protein
MSDDDDGALHYRRVNTRLHVRSTGPRLLRARVLNWQQPVRLSTGGMEWFVQDSARVLDPPVPLRVMHNGPIGGRVVQWRSVPVLGFDAIVEAADTLTGDGLLALVDRWGSVPLSPAWIGDAVRHSTGVEWRRVSFTHLAICGEGELPWCRLRRLS